MVWWFLVWTELNWDFPLGLMPTNGVGGFRDFLPAPRLCKSFFKSAAGFFPAQEVVCRHFVLATPFSSGGEDTAAVGAVIFM
jgi:hypothetical protein